MIKEVLDKNENVTPNSREMAVLKENFPACFKADGTFDIGRFREFLSDKISVFDEGYELKFLGKNYARLLVSLDTTTVIRPNEEHNSKPGNINSENIYISGDNLDGLKHLLKSYSGKVKCIYIDPPYNTGSDGFVYNDRFNFTVEELSSKLSIGEEEAERILDLTKRGSASHSAWLMFIYPRLLLARDLLSKDGVIFISIDDNEQANLKLICDEILGEEKLVANGTVIVKTEGRRYGAFAKTHDYFLAYSKSNDDSGDSSFNEIKIVGKNFRYSDDYGGFNIQDLRNQNANAFNSKNRPNLRYPFYVDVENEDENGFCNVSLTDQEGWVQVYPIVTNGNESVWRWGKNAGEKAQTNIHNICARKGTDGIIRIYEKMRSISEKPKTVFVGKEFLTNTGTKEVDRCLGKGVFEFPKPVGLIRKFLTIGTDKDSIILDFFSGSATTAHAVMQQNIEDGGNRRFIMVQLPEIVEGDSPASRAGYKTIDQIGIERIIRAARAIKEQHPDTKADLGFKHFTLVEPTSDVLHKLEEFNPDENKLFAERTLLNEFGKPTILATWLTRDGYGLTASAEELDLAGYKGYYIDKHLYLIDPELPDRAIEEIVVKYETDGSFNPENIVLFGYSFTWAEMDALKINLKRLSSTEKNLRINFDVRY